MKNGKATHTIMPHSLAQALMEAGMQHFDAGGFAQPMGGGGGATGAAHFGDSGFLGTLFGQNNFNANLAPQQQNNYGDLISQSANQSQNIQAQQQSLANALLSQSQGQGPNPAQAALAQATGQNVAAQNALMAGQRGASANPALLARQAAMQGAQTQQNAAGQAATLQAQQQIAAQQALQQQQATMGQQNLGLFGTAAGAQNAQNAGNVENYGMAQGLNQKVSSENTSAGGGILKNVAGNIPVIGKVLGGLFHEGGSVPERTDIPDHLNHVARLYHPDFASGASNFTAGGPVPGRASVAGNSARNDTVPALLSPGEAVLPRSVTQAPDAPERAAAFVRHLMGKEEAQTGYSKVAESRKKLKKEAA